MFELNFERVNGLQRTEATKQVKINSSAAAVSNPLAEITQNNSEQIVPLEERLKREKELKKLTSMYMEQVRAKNTIPDYTYATRDEKVNLKEIAERNTKNINNAQNKLDELFIRLQNLNENDYNKYFKKLFGIEPDEYRMKSEQNPDFKPKFPSIKEIETVNANISNDNAYTTEEIQQRKAAVVEKRAKENESVKKGLQTAKDNQGFFRKCCSWYIEHCTWGTSQKDVLTALTDDKEKVEELQKIAQTGDDETFDKKYFELTGVHFKIENIEKAEKAEKEYSIASCTNNIKNIYEDLEKEEQYLDSISEDFLFTNCMSYEERYGLNFSNMDSQGNFRNDSPLEKAIRKYFDNDTEKCIEYLDSLDFPEGINDIDIYDTIEKSFLALLKKETTILEKTLGFEVNDKKLKTLKEEYSQSLQNAYGDNIPQEKLKKYIDNVEMTYSASKAGVLLGVYAMGFGPIAESVAVAISIGAYEGIELGTDKDGYTKEDFNETVSTAVIYGLYNAVWGVAKGLADNLPKSEIIKFFMDKGADQKTAQKLAHLCIQAPAMYAGDTMIADMMGDDIDTMTEIMLCLGFSGIDAHFLSDNSFAYAFFDLVDHMQPLDLIRKKFAQTGYMYIQEVLRQQQSADDKQ